MIDNSSVKKAVSASAGIAFWFRDAPNHGHYRLVSRSDKLRWLILARGTLPSAPPQQGGSTFRLGPSAAAGDKCRIGLGELLKTVEPPTATNCYQTSIGQAPTDNR